MTRSRKLGLTADAQWNSSSTRTEQPKFRWHEDGSVRFVYGQRTYASILINDLVCKYGDNAGYGCGTVESKTVDPDGGGPFNAVFVRVADCGGEDLAEPGDSGGPVFYNNTAIGTNTFEDGDIFCGGKMVFNSVTHTQAKLNVSLLFAS